MKGFFFNFKKSVNQLLQFILIFLIKGKQMVSKVTDFFFFFWLVLFIYTNKPV